MTARKYPNNESTTFHSQDLEDIKDTAIEPKPASIEAAIRAACAPLLAVMRSAQLGLATGMTRDQVAKALHRAVLLHETGHTNR